MVEPEPIRTVITRYMQGLLKAIAGPPDYTFDVKSRVYLRDKINAQVDIPSISVLQRTERASPGTSRHRKRELYVNVGFIFGYDNRGESPDDRAVLFIADIQRAMGYEHELSVFTKLNDEANAGKAKGLFIFDEIGSALNTGDPISGRVYGQVDYIVAYETSWHDPTRM